MLESRKMDIAFRHAAEKLRDTYALDTEKGVRDATAEIIEYAGVPEEEAAGLIRTILGKTTPGIVDKETAFSYLVGRVRLDNDFVLIYDNEVKTGIRDIAEETDVSGKEAAEFVREIVHEATSDYFTDIIEEFAREKEVVRKA